MDGQSPQASLKKVKQPEQILIIICVIILLIWFVALLSLLIVYSNDIFTSTSDRISYVGVIISCASQLLCILIAEIRLASEMYMLSKNIVDNDKLKELESAQKCQHMVIGMFQLPIFLGGLWTLFETPAYYTNPLYYFSIIHYILLALAICITIAVTLIWCICKMTCWMCMSDFNSPVNNSSKVPTLLPISQKISQVNERDFNVSINGNTNEEKSNEAINGKATESLVVIS